MPNIDRKMKPIAWTSQFCPKNWFFNIKSRNQDSIFITLCLTVHCNSQLHSRTQKIPNCQRVPMKSAGSKYLPSSLNTLSQNAAPCGNLLNSQLTWEESLSQVLVLGVPKIFGETERNMSNKFSLLDFYCVFLKKY